jgi:lysyl-tRNA synthetase class 1
LSPPTEILPRNAAQHSRAWPFAEARALLERLGAAPPTKGYVLFETGYGPSGLPHIGTFGEVVRTTMVRHAFAELSDLPTRLFAFSDDMDALRKVPDNVPNKEMLAAHLGRPLTKVPDPFGTHESFGHHNNSRLRAFLDAFGFSYEFMSATDCYTSGRFDPALLQVLRHYDEVLAVMLPSLGPERRATYSPFLPICPSSGQVLQVPVVAHDADAGTISYRNEAGALVETPVTGGRCKLQWKPDWAMRWYALGVDYEMAGKDLIDSVKLASRICRLIGGTPPLNFIYELFLDENGEKISKSRGNGLAVEDWLAYAPAESLAYFMYQKPKTAKRLFFGVIPKTVDDYYAQLGAIADQSPAEALENPVWHVHAGTPPPSEPVLGFAMLLDLASVCHCSEAAELWHFISRYCPELSPEANPQLTRLVDYAIRYYHDIIAPSLRYRPPTTSEAQALQELARALGELPRDADSDTIQQTVYEVGKRHYAAADLKAWFKTLYEVLLGQDTGPRMGSFIALFGLAETIALIEEKAGTETGAAAAARELGSSG